MNTLKIVLAFLLVALLAVTGCATAQRSTKAELENMYSEPKLKEGFSVDVVVMVAGTKEVEELDKRVTAKGRISLPLIGDVVAVPLTLKELGGLIEEMYQEYLVKPKVTVTFSKSIGEDGVSPWGSVTVMGRIVKPGKVSIPPTRDLTVSVAIQKSGGFSSSANQSGIKVTRRLKSGQLQTLNVNLKSLGGGKLDEDIPLYPGDVVFVPESIF